MGNIIGYARVSTQTCTPKPQLQASLDYLNPGDVLLIYSTDRPSRSVSDLISIVTGGRPSVMMPERVATARHMREEGATVDTIAATLGVGRATINRAFARPHVSSLDGSDAQ